MPASVESKQSDDSDTVPFTNVEDLLKVIDGTIRAGRDSLTVTNVSLNRFTEFDKTREEQRRRFRFRHYDTLYTEFLWKVRDMGLRSWISLASETLSAQDHSGWRCKEGDSTGGPTPKRGAKSAWPILVVEAGVSETIQQLRLDMRRWFSMSNHQVKMVLLAKFDGDSSQIVLEKWEEEAPPVLRQTITIIRNTATDPVSYDITGAPLILLFRLLFLRGPGPGEGDFVLNVPELKEYAEKVWSRV
ncbi:hypothetical protein N656DRAFT_792171 [Canariomyces notabilis]|uniref:Uncharacterized protein n=1 Tax=Canariomyces notabilis TaxID=2074819 RepID=A0AAN6QG03_9PEZI|nr:hypothetical protein N656DRAFT_792171 [Canariomyces arenarius]